jgi:hypothetical protein
MDSSLELLTQRVVPRPVARRAVVVERYAYPLARAAGAGLGTALVLGLGDKPAVVGAGLVLPAISLLTVGPLQRAEQAARVPDQPLDLLCGLQVFRALPPWMTENLALYARAATFPPGSSVLADDPREDTLYVIEEGLAEGRDQSGEKARLSPGMSFGRSTIMRHDDGLGALTALTPMKVWALTREDIVASLAGSSPAEPSQGDAASPFAVPASPGALSREGIA